MTARKFGNQSNPAATSPSAEAAAIAKIFSDSKGPKRFGPFLVRHYCEGGADYLLFRIKSKKTGKWMTVFAIDEAGQIYCNLIDELASRRSDFDKIKLNPPET